LNCIRILKIAMHHIAIKKFLPPLFLLLALYPIEALLVTTDGLPENHSPVTVDPNLDRFIVRFKNGQGKSFAQTAAKKVHANLGPQNAIAVTLSSEALEGLQNNPNIEYVEQDYRRYPTMMRGYDSNDLFKQHRSHKETRDENHRKLIETVPYGIPMVQADQVSYDSSNPRTVCIIDTGYDLSHEDLPSTNVDGYSVDANFTWKQDGYGHGTHVAGRYKINAWGLFDTSLRLMIVSQIICSSLYFTGTIAAVSGNGEGVVGVAPGVNLFIVRVYADDVESGILGSDLVDAANRCRARGANVINISLGGPGSSLFEKNAYADLYTIHNILIVAAAGNFGNNPGGTDPYPASYDSVMSVGAIDSNKVVASFSQRNDQVDIVAPGVDVLSTVPMGTGTALGSLDVSGDSYIGTPMKGSPIGIVSGTLVDCGIGRIDCIAARGKICLIQRGGSGLYFPDKVLACQNGGGLGAVIYNNVAGDLIGYLLGVDTQIPSIGVSNTDGLYLIANELGNSVVALAVGVSNYAYWDGTSMATPHVSAVAALIWSHDATKTASEVRSALESTAEDLGVPGRDNDYGYGLVQAAAACFTLTGSSCSPSDAELPLDPQSSGPSVSKSPPSGSVSESPPSGSVSEHPSAAPTPLSSASFRNFCLYTWIADESLIVLASLFLLHA
jgi:serine protease